MCTVQCVCIVIYLLYDKMFIVEKDTKERGRSLNYVLKQYTDMVKPAFEEFTLPVRVCILLLSTSALP